MESISFEYKGKKYKADVYEKKLLTRVVYQIELNNGKSFILGHVKDYQWDCNDPSIEHGMRKVIGNILLGIN